MKTTVQCGCGACFCYDGDLLSDPNCNARLNMWRKEHRDHVQPCDIVDQLRESLEIMRGVSPFNTGGAMLLSGAVDEIERLRKELLALKEIEEFMKPREAFHAEVQHACGVGERVTPTP